MPCLRLPSKRVGRGGSMLYPRLRIDGYSDQEQGVMRGLGIVGYVIGHRL